MLCMMNYDCHGLPGSVQKPLEGLVHNYMKNVTLEDHREARTKKVHSTLTLRQQHNFYILFDYYNQQPPSIH